MIDNDLHRESLIVILGPTFSRPLPVDPGSIHERQIPLKREEFLGITTPEIDQRVNRWGGVTEHGGLGHGPVSAAAASSRLHSASEQSSHT